MKINKEEWNRSVYEYPFREKLPPDPKPDPQDDLKNQDVIKHITEHMKKAKDQVIKKIRGVHKNIKNILEKV